MTWKEHHISLRSIFLAILVIGSHAQEFAFPEISCATNADCVAQRAECVPIPDSPDPLYCTCPFGSRRIGDLCYFDVGIEEFCDDEISICVDDGATCVSDGANSGLNRCTCDPLNNKMSVPSTTDPTKKMCAVPVMGFPGCEMCEANEGRCYSLDGGVTPGGCLCPVSRTGVNCEVLHVNVGCDLANFQMDVCYSPHDGIDTTQTFVVYTEGHKTDGICNGRLLAADEGSCSAGNFLLQLPLDKDRASECGIIERNVELLKHRYEAKLYVNTAGIIDPPNLVFVVYCTFQSGVNAMFNSLGAVGVPGNDQGEELVPTISMRVLNQINEVIPDGVALRLGDPIRFEIELENDGTYTALSVVRCTASNYPDLTKLNAATEMVTDQGCPVTGQDLFTLDNQWVHPPDQLNIIQTGLVPMFRMASGSFVYLHCHLKLCVIGSESDCEMPVCDGGLRRKRAAASPVIETDVTSKLIWYEDATAHNQIGTITENSAGYWALIICLAILAVLIIALVGFLIIKRSDSRKVGIWSEMRPQRFAMPRLGNEHVHI